MASRFWTSRSSSPPETEPKPTRISVTYRLLSYGNFIIRSTSRAFRLMMPTSSSSTMVLANYVHIYVWLSELPAARRLHPSCCSRSSQIRLNWPFVVSNRLDSRASSSPCMPLTLARSIFLKSLRQWQLMLTWLPCVRAGACTAYVLDGLHGSCRGDEHWISQMPQTCAWGPSQRLLGTSLSAC